MFTTDVASFPAGSRTAQDRDIRSLSGYDEASSVVPEGRAMDMGPILLVAVMVVIGIVALLWHFGRSGSLL